MAYRFERDPGEPPFGIGGGWVHWRESTIGPVLEMGPPTITQ
jgi:hypothetical protein